MNSRHPFVHRSFLLLVLSLFSSRATAAEFAFNSDPFAGSTALTTPGRQIVPGEPSITFNSATDVFAFNSSAFGINSLSVFNGVAGSIPATGVNVVVLQTFDNDANPETPFGAGNAANLIADAITQSGPGFFIYFNSGLDLPRLVYSTDLSVNTADLAILARMTNLTGTTGQAALGTFGAANFQIATASVPEAASGLNLVLAAGAILLGRRLFPRRQS